MANAYQDIQDCYFAPCWIYILANLNFEIQYKSDGTKLEHLEDLTQTAHHPSL